jgi:hypothetical protein
MPDTPAAGLFAEALKLQMRDAEAAEAGSGPQMPEKKRQILPPTDAAQAATLAAFVVPVSLPLVAPTVAPAVALAAKAINVDQSVIELKGIQPSPSVAGVAPAEVFATGVPIAPGFNEAQRPLMPVEAELASRPMLTSTPAAPLAAPAAAARAASTSASATFLIAISLSFATASAAAVSAEILNRRSCLCNSYRIT